MAQARRVKSKPHTARLGVFRTVNRLFLETGFWLLAASALIMLAALATFSPADSAWTHASTVTRFHNLGGVVGAWFADVALYFFGYGAYLLPLGVAFASWRLFKRAGLLQLDGEIVLLRMLGFFVTMAMMCSLMALHVGTVPGTLPGVGSSSGGLVGMHVGPFLVQAFKPVGGNLFMLLLLLAGVILATGSSWIALFDWVGQAVLNLVDWIGGLVMRPLAWLRLEAPDESEAKVKIRSAPAPAEEAGGSARSPGSELVSEIAALADRFKRRAAQIGSSWQAQGRAAESSPGAGAAPKPAAGRPAAGGPDAHPARIEPVWAVPAKKPPTGSASAAPRDGTADWPLPNPSDLTLVPTAKLPLSPVGNAFEATLPAAKRGSAPLKQDARVAAINAVSATAEPSGLQPKIREPAWPASPANGEDDEPSLPDAPIHWPAARSLSAARPIAAVAAMVRRLASPAPVDATPLPPLELLDSAPKRADGYSPETLEHMSRRVEVLLRHFGIVVQVVAVEPGPVITRFEIEPAPGVKVSQISNLAKDLARGLSVISVRVVEVIPGKSVIGLEIPNQQREIVYLREVLEAPIYNQAASPLTMALGKDIGGNPVVANLAKMPHLLVAGTTGSGKSVAINAMLLSLLYKATPREVRLILVDPKMLELSMYEDIPHLLTPVVTDMKEAANALRWCVVEMDRRYRLMAALKVRNIAGYNRKLADATAAGESITDPFWKPGDGGAPGEVPVLQPLPFVVVVIDELADMMMIVGKKVEELIARLAQKARASGIHLILATQRPSVDVITGLIKANIPTRIAFQVSSRVDSRTILDQMGAEQLLGHGDMLYLPPGTGLPQRVHGAFVDDHEVPRVVDFLRKTGAPDYIDDVLAGPRDDLEGIEEIDNGGRGGESDPLYDEAVRIVTESRRASVSGVQRRLRIGYNRAARLVEEMETAGVVGPVQPNGSREVLAPGPP